jgi:hypothetical protein
VAHAPELDVLELVARSPGLFVWVCVALLVQAPTVLGKPSAATSAMPRIRNFRFISLILQLAAGVSSVSTRT